MKQTLRLLSIMFLSALFAVGCKPDDPEPTGDTIASFQYEISPDNWSDVIFTNYSQNTSTYAWDFGDGNSSTEVSPTHSYAAGGSYEVILTATGELGSASKSETITVVNPNTAQQFLTGTDGKTWYLNREEVAMGIGPGIGDVSWWSFGGVTPLGERPCILDDSFIFNPDGTWEKNTEGTVFVDSDANGGWLGKSFESCHTEDEPGLFVGPNGEDLSSFASGGAYTFDFNSSQNTVVIEGFGAYIGLPNKTENGDSYIPTATKTYTIFNMEEGNIADKLDVAIVNLADGSAWSFYLLSYHNPADLPPLPVSTPIADFSYVKDGSTVTFSNASSNSTSYTWDFGDGGFSADENPVYMYSADGDYTVTLTASDDDMLSDETSQVVSISSAVFTAADLSSAEGKVWKLDGEGSYYVGPSQGSSEWWGGIDAAGVIERACQLDDEFIFYDDGTMEFATQGQVWVEDFLGGSNECIDEGDLIAPFGVYASGIHAFTASDTEITVEGLGAYIGFNKGFNGGELPGDASGTPASSITYEVYEFSDNDGVQRLTITVDYGAFPGESYWTMRMIAE